MELKQAVKMTADELMDKVSARTLTDLILQAGKVLEDNTRLSEEKQAAETARTAAMSDVIAAAAQINVLELEKNELTDQIVEQREKSSALELEKSDVIRQLNERQKQFEAAETARHESDEKLDGIREQNIQLETALRSVRGNYEAVKSDLDKKSEELLHAQTALAAEQEKTEDYNLIALKLIVADHEKQEFADRLEESEMLRRALLRSPVLQAAVRELSGNKEPSLLIKDVAKKQVVPNLPLPNETSADTRTPAQKAYDERLLGDIRQHMSDSPRPWKLWGIVALIFTVVLLAAGGYFWIQSGV